MNFKKLLEKRNTLVGQINDMFLAAEKENRAFNEDEAKRYDELMKEIKDIDKTINLFNESRQFGTAPGAPAAASPTAKETEQAEMRAFETFLRTGSLPAESRDVATANMTMGDNGAVIPTSIARKIIETVKNISPIFQLSDQYSVKGSLVFPKYTEVSSAVTVAYAAEFTALTSKVGKFTSVTLSGNLAGALAKISKSLINNAEFDIVSYVIGKLAEAIAIFMEAELLKGTGATGHMTGVLTTSGISVTAAAATAISADDLIKLQMKVNQRYRGKGVWIMSTQTLEAIRKLKDGDQRYLLNPDIRDGFNYRLLGCPVYESDAMENIAASKKTVVFGDFSGLGVNIRPGVELQLLLEKYADEHAVGAVAWFEADSKVLEDQKMAYLTMAASDPT
ncbi:MAG: phage major capsid protein [Elusimicrobiaceae bacterium]|nr:phage major capsid protein [Elusimicrobiaceae bacterium]